MQKKKISLSDLKVESFVTDINMNGGWSPTCDCSLKTARLCDIECSDDPVWCTKIDCNTDIC